MGPRSGTVTQDGKGEADQEEPATAPHQRFPDPVIIQPKRQHLQTIIMLHGRGSNGQEFADELFESQARSGEILRELLPNYKWVFPTAKRLYSETFREDMNQWYDLASLSDPDIESHLQIDGMRNSVAYVDDVVQRERTTAPSGRVVLGGISQGFSVAVVAALLDASPFEALAGFSSWLPLGITTTKNGFQTLDDLAVRHHVAQGIASDLSMGEHWSHEHTSLPVFVAHCIDDDQVDIELGRKLRDALKRLGHDVTWHQYEAGGHWINEPIGVENFVDFLQAINLKDS